MSNSPASSTRLPRSVADARARAQEAEKQEKFNRRTNWMKRMHAEWKAGVRHRTVNKWEKWEPWEP